MLSADAVVAMRRAMCLTMIADGKVVAEELDLLTNRWEELSGSPFDAAAFEAETNQARAAPDALWAWMQSQAANLTNDEKAAVIKAAVYMVMADAELHEGELLALHRIARALRFPELKGVMNAAWREQRRAERT